MSLSRVCAAVTFLAAAALTTGQASAQRGGLLDDLFGGNDQPRQGQVAQASGADLAVRMDRLENSIRQLTGAVEQMQYRNQQLEQQLRRMQEDTEYRLQEMGGRGGAAQQAPRGPAPARNDPATVPTMAPARPATVPGQPQRRGDAFDPSQAPDAPGAPRVLGSTPSSGEPPPQPGEPNTQIVADEPVGVPGGRSAGAPLDLGTLSSRVANDPTFATSTNGAMPPASGPPPRNTNQQMAAAEPPSQSPKDQFELAYGYVLQKDYGQAEQELRAFLRKYPSDRLVADAQYWLGETMFQRQRYRDAAQPFLTVATKYENASKAPDALLRLGQSLAALGEKETACATLSEVTRKYPRAASSVKQVVEREQKRAKC